MGVVPVLEVTIGLCFVYLLLALIVTSLTEWVSRIRNGRGNFLEDGIRRLLSEETKNMPLTKSIFAHPLVQAFTPKGNLPPYIPAKVFAQVFTEIVLRADSRTQSDLADTSRAYREAGFPEPLARSLLTLRIRRAGTSDEPQDPVLPSTEVLEEWYDNQMDRVSGWYKRHTQTIVLIASIAVAVAANADTVSLTTRLWSDSALRSSIVEAAKARVALGPPLETVEYTDPTNPKPSEPIKPSTDLAERAGSGDANHLTDSEKVLLGSVVGWSGEPQKLHAQGFWFWLLYHVPGWIITALAVSLGAPFWFDTLNRFINIRSAGPPPSSTSASKAR